MSDKYKPNYVNKKFELESKMLDVFIEKYKPTRDQFERYVAWVATQPLMSNTCENKYAGKITSFDQIFNK